VIRPVVVILVIVWVAWFVAQLVRVLALTAWGLLCGLWWLIATPLKALTRWITTTRTQR
jgi:hypothetical protein